MSTLKPSNLCLVVYIDETGQEEFKDLQYPIFGMGGCAVLCESMHRLLDEPWRTLKLEQFGNRDFPFHASSTLASATPTQRAGVIKFFKDTLISRFAAVIKINTVLSPTLSPYQAISSVMFNIIEKILMPYPLDSIALIFEDSERGNHLVQRWFTSLRAADEKGNVLPIDFCFMEKSRREPGLEIADCVVNAAGRHVRHFLRSGKREADAQFEAIFGSVPRPLAHFIEIDAALIEPKK